MRKLLFLIAFLLSVGTAAHGQTYANIVGTLVQDGGGNLLQSGKLCFTPGDANGNPLGIHTASGGQVTTKPQCVPVLNGGLAPVGGTFQLVNTATSIPSPFCWAATLQTPAGALPTPGYSCIQMNSQWCSTTTGVMTCNFDFYPPNSPAQVPSAAPNIAIGTVSTGAPGSSAAASVTGTPPNYSLSLSIPQGQTGATGNPGTPGATGSTGSSGITGPAGPVANWRGAWAPTTSYARNDAYTEGTTGFVVTTAYTSGAIYGGTDVANTIQIAVPSPIAPLGTIAMNAGVGLNFFSDSTCVGQGASVTEKGWANIVSSQAGAGFTLKDCQSSDMLEDTIRNKIWNNVTMPWYAAPINILAIGINNARMSFSGNAAYQKFYQQLMAAAIPYLASASNAWIHPDDSIDILPTGTWTLDSISNTVGVNHGLVSTTSGNSIAISFTMPKPGAVTLVDRVWGGGASGGAGTAVINVTIDGTPVTDTITGNSTLSNGPASGVFTVATTNGTTDTFKGARFAGVTAGAHTLVYTCATADAHGCEFMGLFMPPGDVEYQPPTAIVTGIPFQNGDAQSAVTAAFNALNLSTAAAYSTDGYRVYSVNIRANMNSSTMMQGVGANISGQTVSDSAITTGSNVFTSATAGFTPGSVGKYVIVPGAGASGGVLNGIIITFTNATTVVLNQPAGTTVSAATAYIGALGRVVPASTNVGLHPNDYGHSVEAADILAVLNPTTAGNQSLGGPSPSDLAFPGSFPSAGSNDSTTLNNQGYCARNNAGVHFGCFIWAANDNGNGAMGPAFVWSGGDFSEFNFYGNPSTHPGTQAAYGLSVLGLGKTSVALCGQTTAANNPCTIFNVATAAATPNSATASHPFVEQAQWGNGTTVNTATHTHTFGTASGVANAAQTILDNYANCPSPGCNWNITGIGGATWTFNSLFLQTLLQVNTIQGAGTATFAAGAAAGASPGTPVCVTSHVCDNYSGTVQMVMGATPTTGALLTVSLPITRIHLANCDVSAYLQASPFTALPVRAVPTTTTLVFNAGVAPSAGTYEFTYICGGG